MIFLTLESDVARCGDEPVPEHLFKGGAKLTLMAREAACLAQLGRLDEARAKAAEVLRRKPSFSVQAEMPHDRCPADADRVREALLKAGLPERNEQMRFRVHATWELIVRFSEIATSDPATDSISRLLCDLELNWPPGLSLNAGSGRLLDNPAQQF